MPVRQQSNAPQDKPGCRFYGFGQTYAALAVDLSQFEDDLQSDADGMFENSPRFNYSHPRTMLWHFDAIASSDTGTMWRHGTGANLELVEVVDLGAPTIRIYVNNVVRLTVSIEGPGTMGNMWIAWASQANPDPDATASDAVLSWLYVRSNTGDWQERHRFTHPAKNSESTTGYVGSSSSGGVSAMTEQVTGFGYFSRMMSFTEFALDQWDFRTTPSTVAKTQPQQLEVTAASGIGAQGEAHGAAAQSSVAGLDHTRWRCMGALMNERFKVSEEVDTAWHDTGDAPPKVMQILGSDYRSSLGWFRAYPVSPTANALWVEVHARVWSTDITLVGGAWGLRVYLLSRPPIVAQVLAGGDPPAPLESRYVGAVVDASPSTDPGEYRIRGVMPVVRGASGIARDRVYLAIAYLVDPLGANSPAGDATLRLEVKAVHVVQLFDATDGQPPLGGPGGEAG